LGLLAPKVSAFFPEMTNARAHVEGRKNFPSDLPLARRARASRSGNCRIAKLTLGIQMSYYIRLLTVRAMNVIVNYFIDFVRHFMHQRA
jgi:hypothetical protein